MTTRYFLTAAVLFTLSCSAYGQSESDTLGQPRSQRLEFYEQQFKPSLYDTEIYLYKKNDSTKSYGRSIDQLTSAPPETLQGFRIQLLATNNFDDANTTRNVLTASFPDLWIYLVFEAPTYKIRVGDFVNRAEAKPLLDIFQGQGYRKAWIVPDRIINNQPPKPPVPVAFDSTSVYR
jgi:hypothetical protein